MWEQALTRSVILVGKVGDVGWTWHESAPEGTADLALLKMRRIYLAGQAAVLELVAELLRIYVTTITPAQQGQEIDVAI